MPELIVISIATLFKSSIWSSLTVINSSKRENSASRISALTERLTLPHLTPFLCLCRGTVLYHIPARCERSDALMSDIMNKAAVSATGTFWQDDYPDYWNWGTNTRTTAIALEALIKL